MTERSMDLTAIRPWPGVKWFRPRQSYGETLAEIAISVFIVGLVIGFVFFGIRAVL